MITQGVTPVANGTSIKPGSTAFNLTPNSSLQRNSGQGVLSGNVVTVMLSASHDSNITRNTVLGTVPEAFRPSEQKTINLFAFTDTSRTAGVALVHTDGTITQDESGFARFLLVFGSYEI